MGIAAVAAGTAALVVFTKMVKKYVEVGDMVHKMALRTGFAATTLSELAYAADISGADITMLEKGVKKMSKTIVDASYGLETYLRVFRSLGLEVDELLRMSPEEQFFKIGNAIAEMENDTLRTAAAVDVFGRSGTMLLPFFKEGAEGIAKLREEAHTLGIIFDEEAAAKAAKLKDAQTALKGSVQGLSIAILNDLIPVISDVVKQLTDWFVKNRKHATSWTKSLLGAFQFIAKGIEGLMLAWNGLKTSVFTVAEAITKSITKIAKGLLWMAKLTPGTEIFYAEKLKQLIKDLTDVSGGYREEKEKGIDTMADIIQKYEAFVATLKNVKTETKKAKEETKSFGEKLVEAVLPSARNMKGVLEGTVEDFKKAPEEIGKAWEDVFWRILAAATLFTSSLGSLFDQMTTNQMARIDAEYEARRTAIDNSLMTEKSKADAMEKLDADIEKKRKKAERASAKRTKAVSLMEAIVGTAAAVVQAMKAPFPLNLVLPAIIGAMGAAQVALIAATPLPALAEGGRLERGQLGIVGEEGPELFAPDMSGTVIPMREGAGLGALRPIYLTIAPSYQISTIDEIGVDEFMRNRGLPAMVEAIKVGIMKPELQDVLRIK